MDVWAAGIILLFFLTGKFPLFQSSDDVEALMEIAAIIGRKCGCIYEPWAWHGKCTHGRSYSREFLDDFFGLLVGD